MLPSRSQNASAAEQEAATDPAVDVSDGIASLRRLRSRLQDALDEISRLRDQNRSLEQQIRDLQEQPRAGSGDVILPFDDDPEVLRRTLDEYIAALDRHLSSRS